MRFRKRQPTRLTDLQATYNAAADAGDIATELATLETITREFPEVSWGWFDLGLRQKWIRDWEGSRDSNLRALALVEDPRQSPEAWNLGIAATALGDWATARRAWSAFGITVSGNGAEPIQDDFGIAPIRLNPEPRFAEPELLIDGERFATEVVWARRLCPTRARIENVPFPESGHRFGDVVLHDGDTLGERRDGDQVRGVFNEIALLERSPWATLRTEIEPVGDADLEALAASFDEHGFAAECWTTNAQILCRACSEGSVDGHHDHRPDEDPDRQVTGYVFGIGAPPDEADRLLDAWAAAEPHRSRAEIEPA